MKTLTLVLFVVGCLVANINGQESLLDLQPPITPAQKHAIALSNAARGQHEQLIRAYNAMMKRFWHSPDATPQEIADALGTRAASLFRLGGALAELIVTADPASAPKLLQPTNAFTVNPDGTVMISNDPYVPPSP